MLLDFLRPLAGLATPLGIVWLALLVGTFLLWRRKRRKAALALGVVALLLTAAGSRLPTELLRSLESPYDQHDLSQIPASDAVVLLGGGSMASTMDPLGFKLSPAGDRILVALELLRLRRAGILVMGGGGVENNGVNPTEGEALKPWVEHWRPTGTSLVLLHPSHNTHDEATQVAALVKEHGWKQVIVVTSAYHMRRALGTFAGAGVKAVPAACDFGPPADRYSLPLNPIPDAGELNQFDRYLHEIVGWWVYRWRGWITG